jgi:ribulose-5-phosphate 4-epimerase/fuculose-1-phosphate aldolase
VVAILDATISGIARSEWELRVKLAAAKRLIESMGLGVSVWGHATVRSPLDPARMLLAPFGESFGHATASNVETRPLTPKTLSPAEALSTNVTAVVLHGAIYAAREDAACVLHTHSPYCTALAAAQLQFDPHVTQDAMQFVGRVGYHNFGGVADEAKEMEGVSKAARDADVIFLKNHGLLVIASDVETAFSRLFYIERCCQTQLLVRVRISVPHSSRFHLICCASTLHNSISVLHHLGSNVISTPMRIDL